MFNIKAMIMAQRLHLLNGWFINLFVIYVNDKFFFTW
jgi:hypothetical protein